MKKMTQKVRLEEKVVRGKTELVDGTGKEGIGLCLCMRREEPHKLRQLSRGRATEPRHQWPHKSVGNIISAPD